MRQAKCNILRSEWKCLMTALFGKIHNTTCRCGCCIGCCLPTAADPAPYEVLMTSIPWEVVAPACPDIDGRTGEFTPVDPTHPSLGPCGYCMTYCDLGSDFVDIPGMFLLPLGSTCLESPCGFGHLKFILECNNDSATDCCGRLRLWCGIQLDTGGTLTGAEPDAPPSLCGSNDGLSWVKLSPTVCSCDGGLSAEFDLSVLSISCDEVFGPGPCEGEPTCCQISCDLTGAKVVI